MAEAPSNDKPRSASTGKLILILAGVSVLTFGVIALLMNIMERKSEGQTPFFTVVELFKIAGLRDELFEEVQRQIEQRRQETA